MKAQLTKYVLPLAALWVACLGSPGSDAHAQGSPSSDRGHGTEIGNGELNLFNHSGSFSLNVPDGWSSRSAGARTEITSSLGMRSDGQRMVVQELNERSPLQLQKLNHDHQAPGWQKVFYGEVTRYQRTTYRDGRQIIEIHIEKSPSRWLLVRLESRKNDSDMISEHLKASAKSLRWAPPEKQSEGSAKAEELESPEVSLNLQEKNTH